MAYMILKNLQSEKIAAAGAIYEDFLDNLERHFWCEREECGGVTVFQSPKIVG